MSASSAGQQKRLVGKKEKGADFKGWGDFKRRVAEYTREQSVKIRRGVPSTLTVTRIVKEPTAPTNETKTQESE